MQDSAAPDYAEPLLGWRAWVAVEANGSICLCSPVYHTIWLPGRETVALCHKQPLSIWAPPSSPQHEAPSAACRCGIYASSSLALAAHFADGRRSPPQGVARILGQVFLWGRVVECEHGWRGAYAYPSRLHLPLGRLEREDSTARRVAAALGAYGVPVELVACGTVSELADALARADGPPLSEGGDPVMLSGLAKALKRILTLGKAK